MFRCSPATTACSPRWGGTTRRPNTWIESRRSGRSAPQVNVTTDVIVGFPTEEDVAFERTLHAIDAAGITRVHVFPYSPRPGTVAAELGDRVAPEEKKRRSSALRGHCEVRSRHHRTAKLGEREHVLIDKVADSQCSGYTADYTRLLFAGGSRRARRADRRRVPRVARGRHRLHTGPLLNTVAVASYPVLGDDRSRAGTDRYDERDEGRREAAASARSGSCCPSFRRQSRRAAPTMSSPCCGVSASAGSRPPRSSATAAARSSPSRRSPRLGSSRATCRPELDDAELEAIVDAGDRGDRRVGREGHGSGDEGRDGQGRRPGRRQAGLRARPQALAERSGARGSSSSTTPSQPSLRAAGTASCGRSRSTSTARSSCVATR